MSALRQIQLKDENLISHKGIETAVVGLTRKMDEVKGQVYETMTKHYKEFIQAFDYALDLGKEVAELSKELKAISELVDDSNSGLVNRLNNASDTHINSQRKLKDIKNIIEVLEKFCRIHEDLSSIDGLMDRNHYPSAAFAIQRVNTLITELNPEEQIGCDAKIFTIIRNEIRRKKTTLKTKLESIWTNCILLKIEEDSSLNELSVVVDTFGNVSPLQPALVALNVIDLLINKSKLLSSSIMQHFLIPIVQNHQLTPTIKSSKGSNTLYFTDSQITQSSSHAQETKPQSTSIETLALLFSRIFTVLEFCCQNIFPKPDFESSSDINNENKLSSQAEEQEEKVNLALIFGSQLWPLLHPLLVDNLLSSAIPNSSNEVKVFSAVAKEAFDFESKLIELGLLENDHHELVLFAKNIHHHFASKKHQEILIKARQIIVSEDHNTITVDPSQEQGGLGGKSFSLPESESEKLKQPIDDVSKPSFQFPVCQISVRVHKLMELAYQTLEEATNSSATIASHLFNAARDIFELFRAIALISHAKNLETLPLFAIIFHNDCMYIAHHLVTLGIQFKSRLPPPMNTTATFIDMIPSIKQLGEECFVKQIDRQKCALLETLAQAKRFRETHKPDQKATAEKSLKQVTHQLQHLSKVWKNALPTRIFNACMGHLLDTVVSKIVLDIMSIPDIGEEETHQLHSLFELVIQKSGSLFDLTGDANSAKIFDQLVPNWKRFTQLNEILLLSLAEITERWLSGRASSTPSSASAANKSWVFTPTEMVGLVKALFSDTPLRQRTIALFQ